MSLDDALVGRSVVNCTGCGEERWYGYGACGRCGAFVPGAEQSDTEERTARPSSSDDTARPPS